MLPVILLAYVFSQETTIKARAVEPVVQGRITSANDVPGEGGKGTAAIGEIVKLRAVFQTTASGHTAVVDITNAPTAYDWQIANPPAKYRLEDFIGDDGRCVSFAAGAPGDYYFTVGIAQNVGAGKPLVKLAQYTLTVTGDAPKTPKPPTPEQPRAPPETPKPPPEEDISGVFQLAPKVRDKLGKMSNVKLTEMLGLAANYRQVLSELAAGKITVDEAKRKISELNGKTLDTPEARDRWAEFFGFLNGEMNTLDRAGKLKTPEAVVQALTEIFLGITKRAEAIGGP